MKILFLDVDGVINSRRSAHALGGYPHDFSEADLKQFDWVAIGLVRRLCRETGAQIVLSSTWRYYVTPVQVSEALDLPVIDATTTAGYNDYASRGGEIFAWLAEHPEVVAYAIADDINVMLDEQQPHFVQTDDGIGLTLRDYTRLYMILTDKDMFIKEVAP